MSLFATKSVSSIIAESEGAEVKLKRTLGPGNRSRRHAGRLTGRGHSCGVLLQGLF
jgi:hypothetical protein